MRRTTMTMTTMGACTEWNKGWTKGGLSMGGQGGGAWTRGGFAVAGASAVVACAVQHTAISPPAGSTAAHRYPTHENLCCIKLTRLR